MDNSKGTAFPDLLNADLLDAISQNIMLFFPLFYKNILRLAEGRNRKNPINMQTRVLLMLVNAGGMQPSEIGLRMGISKPNVSALLDKLAAQGYVERRPDSRDRRVTHITITPRGRNFADGRLRTVGSVIRANLSGLDSREIEDLNAALETFRRIISKLGRGSPPG